MSDNKTRNDKFAPMNREQINLCIAFCLRNSDKKISYFKSENEVFRGGMADTFNEALNWCRRFYEENPNCDLGIADYSEGVTIWGKYSILREMGIVSDKEYRKYLENLALEN